MHGNEIWERFLLMFVYAKKRPQIPVVRYVSWFKVQAWTLIQLACAMTIFAVAQFAPIGYIYPLLLTLLVPFRSYILYRLFPEADLRHLDPADETEEEFYEEQRLIHHAFHDGNESVDEEDMAFPTRAEFRGQGIKRALLNHKRRHTIGHGELDDILHVELSKSVIGMDLDGTDHSAPPLEVVTSKLGTTLDAKLKASTSITNLLELEQKQQQEVEHYHAE